MLRLLLALFVLAFAAPDAHALRCGNLLVNVGDQDFRVRARCGEPFWSDRYASVEVVGAQGPFEQQRSVQFDVWYYNFGPREFMRQLVFRDGRLLRDEVLGYGVTTIGADCNLAALRADLSAGEVVARCGEPVTRRVAADTIVRRPAPGMERWRDHRREEWVYDIGDRRFVRIVRLLNGRVTGVDLQPR